MEWTYIILLLVAKILHDATTNAYGEFRGASKAMYNYLTLCTGIGGFVWYGCLIGAFFVMKWYLPIIAFVLTIPLGALAPRGTIARIYCSFVLPVTLLICVALLVKMFVGA